MQCSGYNDHFKGPNMEPELELITGVIGVLHLLVNKLPREHPGLAGSLPWIFIDLPH